ncbi:hypothetical protein ACDP63_11125 [Paracoccus sp. P2]|uniref:hypothetical protein n=1 Tax=Paracoccus sp. P2 TaxID=3248840 RepID=UPI00391EF796
MTVESAKNKAGPFNVTGTSGTFPRDFLLLDEDHLRVIRVRDGEETDLTSGIGHTGIGTADGTVVISTGIQSGDQIYLLRAVPNLQRSDYNAQGRVRTEQVESDLDLTIMQVQDLREAQGRALTLPVSSEIDGEDAMAAALAAPQYADAARRSAQEAEDAASRVTPDYPSRAELAAALPNLAQGQRVHCEGVAYIVDSSATGFASALHPLGIDGVRVESPQNVFFGTFFKTDLQRADLYTTQDPRALFQINPVPIARGANQALFGFDPSMWWDRDRKRFSVHVFQGGTEYDVTEYRSRDLITWQAFYRNLGPNRVRSDTTAAPGGTVPASIVWWMGLHEEVSGPDAGQLYGISIIRAFEDFIDVHGRTIPNMQLYISRVNDRESMTFDAPVRMDFGDTVCRIGFFPVWDGTKWVGFCKNDYDKNIECWTASTLTGAWTYSYTLDYDEDVEGCCVVPEYYFPLGSTTLQRRWHLLTDAYWSGNYWHKVSTDLVNWSPEIPVASTSNIRHGNLYNFAYEPDAVRVIEKAMAYYAPGAGQRPQRWTKLSPGLNEIHPVDDTTYYAEGTDSATVRILFPAAKRPRFVALSDSPRCAIGIEDGEYFSARNGVMEYIGGGINNRSVIELDYDGKRYTCPVSERRGSSTAGLSTQAGFPNLNSGTVTWFPQHRTLYVTDGTAAYTAETVIHNLPGADGMDGAEVCVAAYTTGANGTIRIRADGSNMAIGPADLVISNANGNAGRVYTFRRVGGFWRLLA